MNWIKIEDQMPLDGDLILAKVPTYTATSDKFLTISLRYMGGHFYDVHDLIYTDTDSIKEWKILSITPIVNWIDIKRFRPPSKKPILLTDGYTVTLNETMWSKTHGYLMRFGSLNKLKNEPTHWSILPEPPK